MVYTTLFKSWGKNITIEITGDTPEEQEEAIKKAQAYLDSFLPKRDLVFNVPLK